MLGDSFLDLSPIALLIFMSVVFVAAFVRGYSGFGFSTILMIGAMPVIPPAQLVPLSIALEILASASQAPKILSGINRRYLAILLAASLLGVPVGVYLLTYAVEELIRMAIYVIVLSMTFLLLVWRPKPLSPSDTHLVVAGFIAGAVNGATALSGLVLALFFTASTASSRTMRATMIGYMFFTDVITGGLLLAADHYDANTVWRGLAALPLLLAGVWLGSWRFFATPSGSFKTVVIWLVMLFCAAGLLQFI
ncbi:sulfite exporter TauE/SafE family protein [Tropicibacter oceani]|uniref:Probable membrane transporter protein n=1 Tax=Tropicibacter oceani TaxID=3058420 RepID=A0ABY8QLA4_9RHOB|nr:sulfite exporter TauE/SafE family protein [Tropicibacter oceani]WGW05319.1 sulfite exporter TauE/SafE family protein [Tropicibacter oceani]